MNTQSPCGSAVSGDLVETLGYVAYLEDTRVDLGGYEGAPGLDSSYDVSLVRM